MKIDFFKISLFAVLFLFCSHLYPQQMSESETVKYIQNTFDNYKISFSSSDIDSETRGYTISYHLSETQICYDNPKIIIISDFIYNRKQSLQISFNINDLVFSVEDARLVVKGNSCIAYDETGSKNHNKFISSFTLKMPEELIATRLKNAFSHLQSMSGKGKSAPDPFDNPTPKSNSQTASTADTKSSNSQQGSTNNATKQAPSSNSTPSNLKLFSNQNFSIQYPNSWEIVAENKKVTEQTTVSVQIMEKQKNDYDFRPNINIIVSSKKIAESTSTLVDATIAQNKKVFPTYRLINKNDNISLSGCKGSRVEYSMTVQGYKIQSIQYVIKKSDNTTFTITATLDANKYNEQKTIITTMCNSLKIK